MCKILLPDTHCSPVYLCTVYRAPNSDLSHFEAVMSTLTNIAPNNLNSPIWIAGDFNLPDINWEDSLTTGHNYPHNFAELLLDFINTFGFTQTVDSPTRRNNTLDLFRTKRPSLVTSCKVIPDFSDHEIVHVSTNVISPPISVLDLFLFGIRLTLT